MRVMSIGPKKSRPRKGPGPLFSPPTPTWIMVDWNIKMVDSTWIKQQNYVSAAQTKDWASQNMDERIWWLVDNRWLILGIVNGLLYTQGYFSCRSKAIVRLFHWVYCGFDSYCNSCICGWHDRSVDDDTSISAGIHFIFIWLFEHGFNKDVCPTASKHNVEKY